jgi:hypothetical protein
LIANYQPEYVVQSGDFTGPGTVLGGCAGTIEITNNALEKCVNLTHGPNALSKEIKKEHHACRERRKPSVDVLFRVWALHKRTNHASLSKLAFMERMGKLKHADCTEAEILLVSQHQDCVSCMLAKARAISAIPSSGIRCNIIGKSWSMDYQGPYTTPAIGGYTGRFLFVERSRGYVISFLVKAKTEAFECVSHVHQHCRRFGHTMMELQTDMGSVENSVLFRESCHKLNNDRQERGVEVNPVNINMQKQNVVERYIQTHDNMFAAIMVDNDLLPASFWGLGVSAVTETMNNLTNSLCKDGNTPTYYFEGRSLDLRYQFRVGYGQPVVCTRVSKQQGPKLLGITRNEFGVCVGPGSSQNGVVWCGFISRHEKLMHLV